MSTFLVIYATVGDLRNEIEKIIVACVTLDDASSDLSLVVESVKILNKNQLPLLAPAQLAPFKNGDIEFEKVYFAYPTRPDNIILRGFSFRFVQGQSYGIAGKNGIGKSTITKSFLKLYDLIGGKILVKGQDLRIIDAKSLHQRVCYLTNRPGFFQMSVAENVFYPYSYHQEDLPLLTQAAKKVGI